MKKVKFNKYLPELNEVLPGGLFLNVKTNNNFNTMTIGWANAGIIWGLPIFNVAVRKSRYTYNLIEKTDEFTVSIPFSNRFKKELAFCGSRSGRNYDKIKECGLNKIKAQSISTPVIGGCDLHYECKIKYKQAMDSMYLNKSINKKYYKDNDYHTFYYGEIVDCYIDESIKI